MPTRILLTLLMLVLVAGCASRLPHERDGPPSSATTVDPDALPAVVPRNEPLSRYGNPASYEVFGQTYYVMDSAEGYAEEGVASWYGTKFHGRRTSSGEPYNMFAMTAAHTALPLPTYVRVTHLDNGRSIVVKVNDRGPFVDNRIIDLSYAAAKKIDMHEEGTARVRVEALPGGTPIREGATTTASAPAQAPDSGREDAGANGAGASDHEADAFAGDAWIQLGAFGEFVNAQRLRARAAGADIRNVSVQRGRSGTGGRIYRVRIGPVADAAERDRIFERLERAGIEPGRVVFD